MKLRDLMENLMAERLDESPHLLQRAEDYEQINANLQERIDLEEIMTQIYEHMHLQRASALEIYNGKYKRLKAEFKEVDIKMKERVKAFQIIEKEREQTAKAEEKLSQKLLKKKQQREERVKEQLLSYKSHLSIKVLSERTRLNRENQLRLERKDRKLELYEEAYDKAKRHEIIQLKLNGQQMQQHDIEKGFVELKKVTYADTAEEVVKQYEEVERRRQELEALEAKYEADIEVKKTELRRLKILRNETTTPLSSYSNLAEFETDVINREAIVQQRELDLNRMVETSAEAMTGLHFIYSKLKQSFPGYEDTKLSPSRSIETLRHFEVLMRSVNLSS